MAHKLECVLDGKTSCQIPAVPVTKVPSVETSVKEVSCTASKKVDPLPPADPCKKYQEEKAANKKIAAALKAQVGFDSNQITLKAAGKKTLDEVAKVLNQYPWMAVNIQGHSSASAGSQGMQEQDDCRQRHMHKKEGHHNRCTGHHLCWSSASTRVQSLKSFQPFANVVFCLC